MIRRFVIAGGLIAALFGATVAVHAQVIEAEQGVIAPKTSGAPSTFKLALFGTSVASTASTSATNFVGRALSATETQVQIPLPLGGTLKNLRVQLNGTPGGSASYAVTINDNTTGTTSTCSITSAISACADTSHSVTVAAGDLIDLAVVPSGTPTARTVRWSVEIDATTDAAFVQFGSAGTGFTAARFLGPATLSATESIAQAVVPFAATLKNFYATASVAPGGSASRLQTVDVAGSGTTVLCTIGSAAVTCNDTTHTASVSAAALLDINSGVASSPASAAVSTIAELDVSSAAALYAGSSLNANLSTSANRFMGLGDAGGNATESAVQFPAPFNGTLHDFYVRLNTAPVGAASYTFTVRDNTTSSSVACSITGAATTCDCKSTGTDCTNAGSATLTVTAGDLLDVLVAPASTPAAASAVWSAELDPT